MPSKIKNQRKPSVLTSQVFDIQKIFDFLSVKILICGGGKEDLKSPEGLLFSLLMEDQFIIALQNAEETLRLEEMEENLIG